MRVGRFILVVGAAMVAAGANAQDAKPPVAGAGAGAARPGAATRPFMFAKDTTYYTVPVRADGTVDYVVAINHRLSLGVTKENNAGIPLLESVTMGKAERPEHYAKVWAKLGVPAPEAATPAGNGAANDFAGTEPKGFDETYNGPWTADKDPDSAAYLSSLEARLNLAVEASKRDHLYIPMIRENESDAMWAVLLPHLNGMRQTANALRSRAMLRLGNEDGEGFRRDVVACVRMGRLLTHGATLVERLVGVGCESAGLATIQKAATEGWLSATDVEAIGADLRGGPAVSPFAESVDMGERCFMLEFLQAAAIHGTGQAVKQLQMMGGPAQNGGMAMPTLETPEKDWNAALRKVNWWYDRLGDAERRATFLERRAAMAEVSRDISALKARYDGWRSAFAPLEDRALVMLLPSLERVVVTEARVQADRALTETALALSAHGSKVGRFPATLKELVPTFLTEEPVDPFTGRPLVYRLEGKGYVLLSVGEDGVEQKRGKSDDRVVRARR
jgi:hypothetical protein